MKRIKGFTTMELSIVMLMAGLISSMAYGGYSLFVKQFYGYSITTTEALDLQQGLNLLKRDIDQAQVIYADGTLLECTQSHTSITWSFENEKYLLRNQAARTDTFKLDLRESHFAFRGQVLAAQRAVADEVNFTADYKKMEVNPIFKKTYSNKTLMELAKKNGH